MARSVIVLIHLVSTLFIFGQAVVSQEPRLPSTVPTEIPATSNLAAAESDRAEVKPLIADDALGTASDSVNTRSGLSIESQSTAARIHEAGEPKANQLDNDAYSQSITETVTTDGRKATQLESGITEKEIQQRLDLIRADTEIEEKNKVELLKRYTAAQDSVKNLREANRKTAAYKSEIEKAPIALRESRELLAQPPPEPAVLVPQDATFDEIETLSSQSQERLRLAQESLDKSEAEVKRRVERKSELAKLLEETKQRLDETRKLLESPSQDEPRALVDARRVELETRILALESQLVLYKTEATRHDTCGELLAITRDIAKRDKLLREKEASAWQQQVTIRRQRETERQAIEARRQARESHPALRILAERNTVLAEQRKRLADSLARISAQLSSVTKDSDKLDEKYQKAEQRVRRAGHSTTVGLLLRRQKEELPSQADCEDQIREIRHEMPRANLASMEVEEERESLGDLEETVKQLVASVGGLVTHDEISEFEQMARNLVKTKSVLLENLASDYESYLDDLSELEIAHKQLARQIQKSLDYIGEHVLWIRSSGTLWANDITDAGSAILALSAPEQWMAIVGQFGADTVRKPMTGLSVMLVVTVIVLFQNKLRKRMASLCSTKSAVVLRFRPTIEAICLAAVIASIWPLLLAYLAFRLRSVESTDSLAFSLGMGLHCGAVLMWVSSFLIQILRSEGIAEAHFGWPVSSTKLMRSELSWITLLGIPLSTIVVATEHLNDGAWAESLGRITFVLGMLLFANFMHAMFNSNENVLREAIARDETGWFARIRVVSYWMGVGVPCLLATLGIAGYYYSAQQVSLRWLATLGVAIALLLIYSVAARWCLMKRRKLSMEQARERQQKAAENAETNTDSTTIAAIPIEDQQVDLSEVHEQLRYLLRHAATLVMFVSLWFVWADVLPALKVLDRVVLWEKMVEVSEDHETPDGRVERTKEERLATTTLRHALLAVLLVVATVIIGRNLPALLEVTVLRRMPFDKGGRHAVAVLLKYTVALLGLCFACRTLSLTWSSVQWLAAGMTVGLGFGLQEIFANFISGLILLFERPIRVGDVITLGDVTGTVTNIRIRATTVTNWDRKELIVPNKDLVTGRLLNWTLTDTTNRILITVGIAYGSDPEQARDLIFDVVSSHPNVLDEPLPNVTFEQFAESSLNLVIRAYIASMDVRLSTIHDLHAGMHAALRKAKIEIAFPQRDIHVHGIEKMFGANSIDASREAA